MYSVWTREASRDPIPTHSLCLFSWGTVVCGIISYCYILKSLHSGVVSVWLQREVKICHYTHFFIRNEEGGVWVRNTQGGKLGQKSTGLLSCMVQYVKFIHFLQVDFKYVWLWLDCNLYLASPIWQFLKGLVLK